MPSFAVMGQPSEEKEEGKGSETRAASRARLPLCPACKTELTLETSQEDSLFRCKSCGQNVQWPIVTQGGARRWLPWLAGGLVALLGVLFGSLMKFDKPILRINLSEARPERPARYEEPPKKAEKQPEPEVFYSRASEGHFAQLTGSDELDGVFLFAKHEQPEENKATVLVAIDGQTGRIAWQYGLGELSRTVIEDFNATRGRVALTVPHQRNVLLLNGSDGSLFKTVALPTTVAGDSDQLCLAGEGDESAFGVLGKDINGIIDPVSGELTPMKERPCDPPDVWRRWAPSKKPPAGLSARWPKDLKPLESWDSGSSDGTYFVIETRRNPHVMIPEIVVADAKTGRIRWRAVVPEGHEGETRASVERIDLYEGHVYAAVSIEGAKENERSYELVALEAATGKSVWRRPVPDGLDDFFVSQRLLFVASGGGIKMVDRANGMIVATHGSPKRFW